MEAPITYSRLEEIAPRTLFFIRMKLFKAQEKGTETKAMRELDFTIPYMVRLGDRETSVPCRLKISRLAVPIESNEVAAMHEHVRQHWASLQQG